MTDGARTDMGRADGVPPFAARFDDPRPGAWCRAHEVLTPRNAAHLWSAATSLADLLDTDLDAVRAHGPLTDNEWGRLPWVVSPAAGLDWYGQFVDTVVTLGDDLAAGRCPVPRCTAEEVALHLILEDVTEPADPALPERIARTCRGLPVREWDGRWETVAAALFPYPKVRRLIADGFGGITDDYELVAETGLVRLAVYRWFEAFDDLAASRPAPACECRELP
jgi:hypothetical protein